MDQLEKFAALGLSESTLEALKKKGFEEPSPIQSRIIPKLMQGDVDVLGQAQTGTGKTAAFGLPLIERLQPRAGYVQALVLAPTRELAVQVAEEINSMKGRKPLQVAPIYGGQSYREQLRRLKQGVDIVVGTPGRVIDHLDRGSLDLSRISYLVLDEADEMLNMGFIEDVEKVLQCSNEDKRMLLFSATMPRPLLKIADRYMRNKEVVEVEKTQLTTDLVNQVYFEVSEQDKFEALCRIIDVEEEFYGVVFCRTKVDVETITSKLVDRGYSAEGLHGDVSQINRERTLKKFKRMKVNVLVATDVAARGIDVNNLTHVINYALPQNPEAYVHRIGRTGRAGRQGTAITFVSPEEYRKLLFIKRITKTDIKKQVLPNVTDVINIKIARLKRDLDQIIAAAEYDEYLPLAQQLLSAAEPEQALAAVLKHAFHEELDQDNYSEIREVTIKRNGRTRLFVALGSEHNMTPKRLIQLIEETAGVDGRNIRDVRIMKEFSFISAPFEEAELILDSFEKQKKGRRSLVSRAKEKDRERGDSRYKRREAPRQRRFA